MKFEHFKTIVVLSILYTLLTIFFTFPLILHFNSNYIGYANDDTTQYIWNFFTFWDNIKQGNSIFATKNIFYPEGSSLVLHTYTPSISIWGIFFNSIFSININIFLHFLFSALGGFYFAKNYIKHNIAAFFIGFLFAFSPYKLLNLPLHYNLILTATIPWFCLFFVKSFQLKSDKNVIEIASFKYLFIALGLLCCTIFIDYQIFFFEAYFAILYILILFYFSVPILMRKAWIILPLLFVFFHVLIDYLLHHSYSHGEGFYWSADFLNLFIPHNTSIVYNKLFPSIQQFNYFRKNADLHAQIFIGYAFAALTIFAIAICIKHKLKIIDAKIFLILAIAFLMICVPRGHFAGIKTLNFPFGILHFVPILEKLRISGRFISMVYLVLPLFTCIVLEKYIQHRKNLTIISLAVLILTIIEFKTFNYAVFNKTIPLSITQLKNEPNGTLLCLPSGIRDGSISYGKFEPIQLYYQTIHHKPMIGGYISRVDESIIKNYKKNKVIQKLFELSEQKFNNSDTITEEDIDQFYDIYKVKYFLIKNYMYSTSVSQYLQQLLMHKKVRLKLKDDQFTLISIE